MKNTSESIEFRGVSGLSSGALFRVRANACKIGKDLNYRPYVFEGGGTPAPSGLRSYPVFPPLSFRAALFFGRSCFTGYPKRDRLP